MPASIEHPANNARSFEHIDELHDYSRANPRKPIVVEDSDNDTYLLIPTDDTTQSPTLIRIYRDGDAFGGRDRDAPGYSAPFRLSSARVSFENDE